jgi:ribosomal protein S12 methylthiotransferase accessory factor
MRRKNRFASLVQPYVGLVERVSILPQQIGSPPFEVSATTLGDLACVFQDVTDTWGADQRARPPGGGSADIDAERAWIRAVAESAERYATIAHSTNDFILASARELGSAALALERLPRCSEREYADPKCPLRPPDIEAPIRWIRGYSLTRSEEVLVPAVLVHLHLSLLPAERFWLPISTGVAAHTQLETALVSAICESIERDAIALTWLLHRELPRIEAPEPVPAALEPLQHSLRLGQIEQHFFDATTDLSVPTVFSIQLAEAQSTSRIHVSCATALDPVTAYAKTIYEPAPGREAIAQEEDPPDNIADFVSLMHGAAYYGRRGPQSDFEFLLGSKVQTSLDQMSTRASNAGVSGQSQLGALVNRLRMLGMEAIAVDLTTDELRDVGLWVVRVIVPELLPVSFVHRARYLGTPRLYNYAAYSGFKGFTEEQVSECPIPFA